MLQVADTNFLLTDDLTLLNMRSGIRPPHYTGGSQAMWLGTA